MTSLRPEHLLRSVSFTPGYTTGLFEFDAEHGFLKSNPESGLFRDGGFSVVGFSNTVLMERMKEKTYRPLTTFAEVPELFRDIDSVLGKGIGPRLYTSREGVDRRRMPHESVGLFGVTIDWDSVKDMRGELGGSLHQISLHAQILAHSAIFGIERTVNMINDAYGDAAAIVRPQPPVGRIKQMLKGQLNPSDIEQSFMLIRDPAVEIVKVGEVQS